MREAADVAHANGLRGPPVGPGSGRRSAAEAPRRAPTDTAGRAARSCGHAEAGGAGATVAARAGVGDGCRGRARGGPAGGRRVDRGARDFAESDCASCPRTTRPPAPAPVPVPTPHEVPLIPPPAVLPVAPHPALPAGLAARAARSAAHVAADTAPAARVEAFDEFAAAVRAEAVQRANAGDADGLPRLAGLHERLLKLGVARQLARVPEDRRAAVAGRIAEGLKAASDDVSAAAATARGAWRNCSSPCPRRAARRPN